METLDPSRAAIEALLADVRAEGWQPMATARANHVG